ncbi:MAG: DUF2339 domain-containing protein, partial [Mycobacteriaceae bacterium]
VAILMTAIGHPGTMSGMTQQPGDHATVERLAQEVVALGGRLQQLGRELQSVQASLGRSTHPAPTQPAPAAPPRSPWAANPQHGTAPAGGWLPPQGFPPQGFPPPGFPPQQAPWQSPPPNLGVRPPAPLLPPKPSWWQREGAASRVLAIAGSVITLLGVVMFLVLAIQNGYLGPVPRVIGGGVLIGAALLLRGRRGGEVGAVALAGTGTAGLYLDVVAATALYGWLPDWAGLLLGFAIAVGGLALAHAWSSEILAVLAVLGAASLSPVLTGEPDALLTSFLLVLSVASGALQLRHRWRVLFTVRAVVPVVAAALSLITVDTADTAALWATVLSCALVTAAGVGFALLALHKTPSDTLALSMMALSVAPAMLSAAVLNRWSGAAVVAGLALVLIALRFGISWLPRAAQVVLTVLGAGAVFEAMCIAGTVDSRAALLFAAAVGLVAIAHRMRSELALGLAVAFGAFASVLLLPLAPPTMALDSTYAENHASWPAVVACLLLAVTAVALSCEVHWSNVLSGNPLVWIVGGAATLYGVTTAFVSAGVLLPISDGFVAGHTTATVTWMVAALVLLGKGLTRGRLAVVARVSGFVLAGAAVAKLLLFDLAALDGILRVTGFILVGLLLIAAGIRYARSLGEQHVEQDQAPPMQR